MIDKHRLSFEERGKGHCETRQVQSSSICAESDILSLGLNRFWVKLGSRAQAEWWHVVLVALSLMAAWGTCGRWAEKGKLSAYRHWSGCFLSPYPKISVDVMPEPAVVPWAPAGEAPIPTGAGRSPCPPCPLWHCTWACGPRAEGPCLLPPAAPLPTRLQPAP